MPFSSPIFTDAIAHIGQLPRKMSLDDVDEKESTYISDVPNTEEDAKPVHKPSPLVVACAIVGVLMLYAAWSVWLYYYFMTRTWPLPRGPLNSTDGLLHALSIVTKTFIAVLGFASLVVPFVLYRRTCRPGLAQSSFKFGAWIFFGIAVAVVPLALYYGFMCFMQYQAFSAPCDASEDVTIFFAGSPHGLSRDGTTATLYSTAEPATKLAVYTLSNTGLGEASLTRSGGGEYFRVQYAINDGMNYTAAMAFTTQDGPVAFGASGNLTEMILEPQNVALRALGEVLEHPLNFHLVDASHSDDAVLRTLATNPKSCRSLKLCAKGWADSEARARFLIPMGWALYKHAAHAFAC